MMKNKAFFILIAFVLVFIIIASFVVNSNRANTPRQINNLNKDDVNIVASIYPYFDWANVISSGVDGVNISLLARESGDMHSFQPSVSDIALISQCDLFIYTGGESDVWVQDVIKNIKNSSKSKEMISVNCFEVLSSSLKYEDDQSEYDEHVWLSVKNAKLICEKIAQSICQIDKKNKVAYEANLASYSASLDELDRMYKNTIENSSKNEVVFADRFPFRYLLDDYGVKYYAAFPGCSSETNASFETITSLAKKIDEHKLGAILKLEGSSKDIAYRVRSYTNSKNQEILAMDSMQSYSSNTQSEYSYYSVMYDNMDILERALK